ncbi:hypothetical protein V1227_10295 [Lentzea sp. DG1S-22]|uniref:hypothetical protein n=1 Tax=Lentzea sp. DG1S-22 TaxID=3108822 RepID=UPI002E7A8F73|nr:hypothetical protein [Lentzea sp. DG1S-22]WVH83112.1 hypothetical protein V1227_10295 [Lentzea sp. DG1S-22]
MTVTMWPPPRCRLFRGPAEYRPQIICTGPRASFFVISPPKSGVVWVLTPSVTASRADLVAMVHAVRRFLTLVVSHPTGAFFSWAQ